MAISKLIIQIPCYNEEETLPITIAALPRELPGIDQVEWMIIDDGSKDRTVEVGKSCGVHHVLKLGRHQGLARAFTAGIDHALSLGADLIVNTDADNQYCADDIVHLIQPVLNNEADVSIGSRPIMRISHYTLTKKILQRVGSWLIGLLTVHQIKDATSGFRAFSRDAAIHLTVFGEYTYTLEMLFQVSHIGLNLAEVPVRTNKKLRPSRLIRSTPQYLINAFFTIIRAFATYRPIQFFAIPGTCALFIGVLIGIRFLAFWFTGAGTGHVQSLILSALLVGIGFFLLVVSLIVDLIANNRKILENINFRVKKMDYNSASR
jgi:glycosyltransferase involved in cell wall biosynthesis